MTMRAHGTRTNLLRLAPIALAAAAFAIAPFVLDLYWIRIVSSAFMYAVLATAINIIAGYAGYAAFGNVVFFGLGAYTTTIMMLTLGAGFAVGLVAGVAVAVSFAILVGMPLLRLKGHYFAIATLGLNEMTRALVENWADIGGGGKGLSLPLPPGDVTDNALFFYFLWFVVLAGALLITQGLVRGRFGYACRAIRIDEDAASSSGVNTTLYKNIAWSISAAITALAGGIYAYWFSYIDPASVFDMNISVKAFVVFLIGGPATVLGPAIAAIGFEFISAFVWGRLLNFHLGVFGVLIVLAVIFMPRGFVPFLDRVFAAAAKSPGALH